MSKYNFYTDAAPIRAHVQKLNDYGIGVRQVAKLANVSYITVQTLMTGHSQARHRLTKKITTGAAIRLLKVEAKHENLAPGRQIPVKGARRRIQALCAQGYSLRWQCEKLGYGYGNLQALVTRTKYCERATFDKIDALFNEYAYKKNVGHDRRSRQAVTRTINDAKKRGWLPAAAWDDIDLDKEKATRGCWVAHPDDTARYDDGSIISKVSTRKSRHASSKMDVGQRPQSLTH